MTMYIYVVELNHLNYHSPVGIVIGSSLIDAVKLLNEKIKNEIDKLHYNHHEDKICYTSEYGELYLEYESYEVTQNEKLIYFNDGTC